MRTAIGQQQHVVNERAAARVGQTAARDGIKIVYVFMRPVVDTHPPAPDQCENFPSVSRAREKSKRGC